MHTLWGDTRSWLIAGSIAGGAILLSLVMHRVLFALATRFFPRRDSGVAHLFVARAKKPALFIFPLIALVIALPAAPFPQEEVAAIQRGIGLGIIFAFGWTAIMLLDVATDTISSRYTVDVADNLAARRIRTQTELLRRIVVTVVMVVTVAVMLMTFPAVQHIGVSLLASAGLAGLVAGVAARSTLASLIAGIQVALTQPIRLEEIGTTYVVVRIWDLRRLVLPLTYFIEKPFQNWTRTTADLLGVVMLYADYRLPVEEARQELRRILESSDLWDKKAWALQVTDATEKTIQLRALMSASNGPRLFDLRCYVREMMIRYLESKHPESLPLSRQEIVPDARGKAVEGVASRGVPAS